MEFIVRILFTGMMAFIPNSNGTQLDVVLLNVGHGHQISDGTGLPHHQPIIITRAGSCTGTCPTRDATIASYLFSDKTIDSAQDALEAAVAGGGAWQLSGTDVSVVKGSSSDPALPALSFTSGVRSGIIPTTSGQREDISWLAQLSEICPTCGLDSSVTGNSPPTGLVAARIHLTSGNVFTYEVARIGSDVTPVRFKRLDGSGSASTYSQAIASWIGVDIVVSGDSIKLDEADFGGTPGRTMTLTPDEDNPVEIAVLNLPPLVPALPSATPGVGRHFERYYDLAANPPSASSRLVPIPGAAPGTTYSQVTWSSIHPASTLWSSLLNALRLNVDRSPWEIALCPPLEP